MSRQLAGRLTANTSGTFTASLPAERGSTKRVSATFEVKGHAQNWLDAAITARKLNTPLPDPAAYRSPGTPPALDAPATAGEATSFRSESEEFLVEYYRVDNNGDLGREEQVRRYLNVVATQLERLGVTTVEAVTPDVARKLYAALLVPIVPDPPPAPAGLQMEAQVTKTEVLALLKKHGWNSSESAFKRARAADVLRPVGTGRTGAHLFRVGDVFDPNSGLAKVRDTETPRYARSTLVDVRWALLQVLERAQGRGVAVQPGVFKVKVPRRKNTKPKSRDLTLPEMARLAPHLHVVHQVVLFMLRLLGLRASEVFGILLEDVFDSGPGEYGVIFVQSQGGRTFRTRDEAGGTLTSTHKDDLKRDSVRPLVVPPALMDVIRTVIEVFHSGDDGTTRPGDRLIPGLRTANESGQSSFRDALAAAAAAECITLEAEFQPRSATRNGAMQVNVTSQAMRRSFATSLDAEQVEDLRVALGHRRGGDVVHLHYRVESTELKPQRQVAQSIQAQLGQALPDGLFIPTPKSVTTHNQPALLTRAPEIDDRLFDLGWQIDLDDDPDWITIRAAAELRGVSEQQIRDDRAQGKLRDREVRRGSSRQLQYLVHVFDVLAMVDQLSEGSDIAQLAAELDVPYDTVRQFIRRHPDMELLPKQGRTQPVSDDQTTCTRDYFAAQRQLESRATRSPEAARELGISVPALNTLIRHGRLTEDARFHGGIRSITTQSLASYKTTRRRE